MSTFEYSIKLRLGPEHGYAWWAERNPHGDCPKCGGDCDGPECGLHAAGCIFGGPGINWYWMIADGCPRFHGEALTGKHKRAASQPEG